MGSMGFSSDVEVVVETYLMMYVGWWELYVSLVVFPPSGSGATP